LKDKKTKKELIEKYKERQVVGGVYIIRNKINNKVLLDAATDLQASKNRFEFSKQIGVCTNLKLQKDWNEFGSSQFVFEVLEELEKGKTQTASEFLDDISVLKDMWLDKISESDF
jgi:hypothetical protein